VTTAPPIEQALTIARTVRDRGGRALVVGGYVRDRLLGIESTEVDIEVFDIPEQELRALLEKIGRVEAVGQHFSVYKIGAVDVALPRRESKTGRGHKGFEVVGDPNLDPKEAARRRDFTINAISWDPLRESYLDPFNGRYDLADRVLRVVDPLTFGDDSLRVLRAIQFAARFEARLDPDTFAICRAIPLDDLPAERIWGEFEKLLLQAARPSLGLQLALDLGIVDRLWPELRALVGCEQDPEWHPEGDVWVHTLMVVDGARQRLDGLDRGRALTVMLGAVTHDFGKPATTAFIDGHIRSRGHEAAGVAPATAFLDRLNIHTIDGFDVRKHVLTIVSDHLAPGMWHKSSTPVGDGAFRRLAARVDLELLARVAEADCEGRTGRFDCSAMRWFRERAEALGVQHAPPAPILLGRHLIDLGLKPGPEMGVILKQAYERQLDNEFTDLDGALAFARTLLPPA
jgi:tRNA nucleotidyltransferase (CCA-adding enzyme)